MLTLIFCSLKGTNRQISRQSLGQLLNIGGFKMQAAAQDASFGIYKNIKIAQPSIEVTASDDKEESNDELEESDEEFSSLEEGSEHAAPSENKSFASTYWRPERHDRKGALSAIDER